MRSIGLPELLILSSVLLVLPAIGLILLFSVLRGRQQRSLQKSVLDRLSSGPEVAAFLQSAAGERFIRSISEGMTNPAAAILASVHRGIVILALGAGFFLVGTRATWGPAPAVVGILLMFLGGGFLVSAAVSYRLSKSWRLLNGAGSQAGQ